MAIRNPCVVWALDHESGKWDPIGEPLPEREACKNAAELRSCGVPAKALKLGEKPNARILTCHDCGAPLQDGCCNVCPVSRDEWDPIDDRKDIQ